MSNNDKATIKFGDKYFEDVTNETVVEETFSLYEAYIYGTENRRIAGNM